jgi:hypothetical protein
MHTAYAESRLSRWWGQRGCRVSADCKQEEGLQSARGSKTDLPGLASGVPVKLQTNGRRNCTVTTATVCQQTCGGRIRTSNGQSQGLRTCAHMEVNWQACRRPCHVCRGNHMTSDVLGKESGTWNPSVRDSGWAREILESDKLAGSMACGIWCAGQPQPVAPHNLVMHWHRRAVYGSACSPHPSAPDQRLGPDQIGHTVTRRPLRP